MDVKPKPEPELRPGEFLDPTGDIFETQDDTDDLEKKIEEEKEKNRRKTQEMKMRASAP
jgi:cell division protein FtsL